MTVHDCGHTCCPIRNDRFHDHFLTPQQCVQCAVMTGVDPDIPMKTAPMLPPTEEYYLRFSEPGRHIAAVRRDDGKLVITFEPDVTAAEAIVAAVDLLREAYK